MMSDDQLVRFLKAQERDYSTALAEIRNGRKQSHWIWYIFPQISGLGSSTTSESYAINDVSQAKEYFQHPVLGTRLIEISKAVLAVQGRTANQIMGSPDDLKLRSCMTLFNFVDNSDLVFQAVLDKYFSGQPDPKTLAIVKG